MSKTVIRGPWPDQDKFHVIRHPSGKEKSSPYAVIVDQLMSANPGSIAIEYDSETRAKALVKALNYRVNACHLSDKLMPIRRKGPDGKYKVWVIYREKAQ